MVKFHTTQPLKNESYDFKLLDFNYYNNSTSFPNAHLSDSNNDNSDDYDNDVDDDADDMDNNQSKKKYAKKEFRIQMFGINEKGQTCSIIAENFHPFFYLLVPDSWDIKKKEEFIQHIKSCINSYYHSTIHMEGCKIIKRRKLYGFDAGRDYKFIKLEFTNMTGFNQVKNLWYTSYKDGHTLLKSGYKFRGTYLQLYEANIPAILRFFHLTQISPSGWIQIPTNKTTYLSSKQFTSCDYEFCIDYKHIIALSNKETIVPYKILSFDIEANSSHGDFPIPKKTYKKVAQNIFEFFERKKDKSKKMSDSLFYQTELESILLHAFNINPNQPNPKYTGIIEKVFPKPMPSGILNDQHIKKYVQLLFQITVEHVHKKGKITSLFERFESNYQITDKETASGYYHNDDDDNCLDENNGDFDDDDNNTDDDDNTNESIYSESNVEPKTNLKIQIEEMLYEDKINEEISDSAMLDILNEIGNTKDRIANINKLDELFMRILPELEGDQVTFIGSTLLKYGDKDPYMSHCIVLKDCEKMPDVENGHMETYDTEKEVLVAWTKFIQRENPDIIIGYNIFGFDYEFMFYRAEENNCLEDFLKLSRNKHEICSPSSNLPISSNKKYQKNIDGCDSNTENEYKLSETSLKIASGEYLMRYIQMTGRLQIDLYLYFRREYNLSSYKLDSVSSHFISDTILSLSASSSTSTSVIKTKNMTGLIVGSYIHIEEIGHTSDYYQNGEKFQIIAINYAKCEFVIKGCPSPDFNKIVKWGLAKDDVSPQDIFRMTNGSLQDRALIAKYCVQDCNLVHYLANKIDIITDFVEMSQICSVPINFLIMRGQGIKLFSLLANFCRENKTLIPVIEKTNDGGYEGAIVLRPKCDLYLDKPIAVNDYTSLYPSSMISENISHDSKVWTKEYDLHGTLLRETGIKGEDNKYVYDNLPEYNYVNITYDAYKYVKDPKKPSAKAKKVKCGHKICRFAQFPNHQKAIVPSILERLLKARKDTRALQKTTQDDFMKNILEVRQLNYKKCANSVYGQCGASTSSFYEKDVAASTTATGRLNITYAKRIIEECYGNNVCTTHLGEPVLTNAEYIYGDSVASYTPVYIRRISDKYVDIVSIEELAEKYGENKWRPCLEAGKQEKEVCPLEGIETWTDKGWTTLYRIIRHILAPHKKLIRIATNTGLVDATDDHSLLLESKRPISPKEIFDSVEKNPEKDILLLHYALPCLYTSFDGDATFWEKYKDEYLSNVKKTPMYCFQNWTDAAKYANYRNHISRPFEIYVNVNGIYIHNPCFREKKAVKKITELPTYEGYVYDLTTENHHFAAGVGNLIVHNTDSIFYTFNLKQMDGTPIVGKKALEITIELAKEVGELASSFLKMPHNWAYEKTFMPFCLLAKKKYVGILYEDDPNKGKRKEMGIVLKRRDNAPIVKDVYGGIIDILLKKQDILQATEFLQTNLKLIANGEIAMNKLIITKQLRSGYAKPMQIAHKVLADRISDREPGNGPKPGDRIDFVYIQVPDPKKGQTILQGNKIEKPDYILANKLKIDYTYYITNQIMKPVQQVFSLVLEKIWEKQNKGPQIRAFQREIENIKRTAKSEKWTEEKLEKNIEDIKQDKVEKLLFEPCVRVLQNKKMGVQNIQSFFTPTSSKQAT